MVLKLVIISEENRSLIIILSLLWPQLVNVRYYHHLYLIICLNVVFLQQTLLKYILEDIMSLDISLILRFWSDLLGQTPTVIYCGIHLLTTPLASGAERCWKV